VAAIEYFQIIPKGNIINSTVVNVKILGDEITLITPPVKILFWINRAPKTLKSQMDKVIIMRANYSIKQIYDLENNVFKIIGKGKEFFIIADFFDPMLNQKLMEVETK
jgi:hypothetical protein